VYVARGPEIVSIHGPLCGEAGCKWRAAGPRPRRALARLGSASGRAVARAGPRRRLRTPLDPCAGPCAGWAGVAPERPGPIRGAKAGSIGWSPRRPRGAPRRLIAGYHPLGGEIWSQTHGAVDAFVHAAGVAASSRGVASVLKRYEPGIRPRKRTTRSHQRVIFVIGTMTTLGEADVSRRDWGRYALGTTQLEPPPPPPAPVSRTQSPPPPAPPP